MGKFLQPVLELHTQVRMFGTFILDNVNDGGSSNFILKNLLPDNNSCHTRDNLPRA